jgi:hypothetical protein
MVGPKGMRFDELFMKTVREELPDARSVFVYTDFVPREDIPLFYNAARVFCFPSFYEGFGLPVLEAMACGVPTVTSHVSSLPEVAGDAALLVDPHRVEDIAEALYRALTDASLHASLSRRGVSRAHQMTETAHAHVCAISPFLTRIVDETRHIYGVRRSASLPAVCAGSVAITSKKVAVLRTAPWPLVQQAIAWLQKSGAGHDVHLVVQQEGAVPSDLPKHISVVRILPSGPCSVWSLGLSGLVKLWALRADTVVLPYNNVSGHGYGMLRLVAWVMAGCRAWYIFDARGVMRQKRAGTAMADMMAMILVPWYLIAVAVRVVWRKRKRMHETT